TRRSSDLPDLERLLRDGLIREDADPDLTTTLDVAGHRDTRSLDGSIRDPATGQRLKAVVAERHRVATVGFAAHAALHLLPILDPPGSQHGRCPPIRRSSTCDRGDPRRSRP